MRFLTVVALGGFLLVSGFAQARPLGYGYGPGHGPGPGPGFTRQAQQTGPSVILQEGLKKLMKFVGSKKQPNRKQLAHFLNTEIAPYFDFHHMARWSSGPRWRQMSEQQREKMAAKLKQNFLGALVQKLSGYAGQNFRMLPPRRSRGGAVSVNISIENPGRYPARMKFRFYRGDNGWKVYDVEANGNSAVAYYRQYFRSQYPARRNAPRYR
ncbi:MAG: ABC transporter substrate-binding protein [Sedimenticola sp.]